MKTLTTLIVADDHPIFLEGLTRLLSQSSWLELLEVATDRDRALEVIIKRKPKFALVALSLFGTTIERRVEFINKNRAITHLIALTMLSDESRAQQLLAHGLSGYVLKDTAFEDLLTSIKQVDVTHKLTTSPLVIQSFSSSIISDILPLTHRESEVLMCVAKGDPNKEIAYKLNITQRTVCFHISNCFKKLKVTNRTQAIIKAITHGLIDIT